MESFHHLTGLCLCFLSAYVHFQRGQAAICMGLGPHIFILVSAPEYLSQPSTCPTCAAQVQRVRESRSPRDLLSESLDALCGHHNEAG